MKEKDVFCKIIDGEIPCYKLYEDEDVLAFLDISQVTRGHALVVPKRHYDNFLSVPHEEMHKVMDVAQRIGQIAIKFLMFHLMRTYFADYDAEIHRNMYRWPTNDAASELRDPFKNTSQYKEAETETINWCSKRVNYLEKRWGTGRPNVNTNA